MSLTSDPPPPEETREPCHVCGTKTSFKTVVDDALVFTCLACAIHPSFNRLCDPPILL